MPAVGSAFVELVLDQTRFSSGLSSAEGKLKSFGGSAGKTMTGFQKVSTAAFLGVGAAAVIGLGKAMEATQQLGEETMKLGRQLGLSAEDASRLISVGKDLGVGFDQLSVGFGIFEKKLVDGGKQFEKYGISLHNADGSQRSFTQVLKDAAAVYNYLPAGVQRTTFAMDVFGKSGKALMPILAQGAAGIERLMKKSDELGTTLSGKTVRATHELAIQQRELQQAFLGVEVKIGQALIPAIQKLMPLFDFAAKHADILLTVLAALAALKLASSIAGWVGSLKTLVGAEQAAAAATTELTVASTSLASALAGPVVAGVAAFAIALIEANNAANKQFALINADIAAVQRYGASTEEGAAATKDFSAQIHSAYGRLAGFSAGAAEFRGRMQAATSAIRGASGTANTYEHSIKGATDAMGSATGEAYKLKAALDALHSKTIRIETDYYDYHFRYEAGGPPGHRAHGGTFRAAGGAYFMGPRGAGAFQAGEGGYATPVGIGTETVGSRGILPLDYATLGKIGDAIGARIQGGGGNQVHLHFHGPVAEETRAFARRLAPDLSRELGRIALVKRT